MKIIPTFEAKSNHKFELHYSDGIRGVYKGDSIAALINKATNNPHIKEWAVYKNEQGFHSTADEKYLVKWWGERSYWDVRAKKDPKIAEKMHK